MHQAIKTWPTILTYDLFGVKLHIKSKLNEKSDKYLPGTYPTFWHHTFLLSFRCMDPYTCLLIDHGQIDLKLQE